MGEDPATEETTTAGLPYAQPVLSTGDDRLTPRGSHEVWRRIHQLDPRLLGTRSRKRLVYPWPPYDFGRPPKKQQPLAVKQPTCARCHSTELYDVKWLLDGHHMVTTSWTIHLISIK